LTKQHGDELRPAGKALGGTLGGMLLYECGKLGAGKVLEQLIEQARDLYDWIALLWGAFGEDPGKEWLANVNYRRALPLFQTAKTCFGQECFKAGLRFSFAWKDGETPMQTRLQRSPAPPGIPTETGQW
jgi:hypothetical protein